MNDIVIGKNVLIGNNVTILPGTQTGDNSVVGVGSGVKGFYPDNVIIQGTLGKAVKHINVK